MTLSPRLIKKYPNRRLYDTTQGSYITLAEIKKLVIEQVYFQVIDARTKKDLTQNTLLQIILEQEEIGKPIFTTAILQDFIRFYHEKSRDAFSQYLAQATQLFTQQKEFFKTQWQSYQTFLANPALMEQALKMQKTWSATMTKKVKKAKKS